MVRFILLILVFLSFGLQSLSQQDSITKDFKRETLGANHLISAQDTTGLTVISASRTAKKLEELPLTIHVITHEDIIRNNYITLTDVLKSMPGIRVSQPGSGETGELFQIRGLIGNGYTKILVNNLPVKPSVLSGMPISAQLPVRQAERIEVIYGPSAAVYGADAVTGVINIITKESDQGTFVRGDLQLGEYEYDYINFMIGGKAGKNKNMMQYAFYGNKMRHDKMNVKNNDPNVYNPLYYLHQSGQMITINGQDYNPIDVNEELLTSLGVDESQIISEYYQPNYEGGLTTPDMQDLPSASHLLGFNVTYRGFTLSYDNMYRRAHSSLGRSTYLYKYNNPQNYWGESINRAVISYEKVWEKFSSSSHLCYLGYSMDNNSSEGLTSVVDGDRLYRYAASDDIFLEQILTYSPNTKLEIVSGISYQYSANLPTTSYLKSPFKIPDFDTYFSEVEFTDSLMGEFGYNPVTFQNISSFIQGYYIWKNFRLMGGIRHDYNSLYGGKFNPRIAALGKIGERSSWRASYGYAYKAPASSLTYESLAYNLPDQGNDIMYIAVPNRDLEPEKFQSVELGINRRFFKNVYFDLALFYNEIENLIVDGKVNLANQNLSNAYIPADTAKVRMKYNSATAQSILYGIQTNIKFKEIMKSVHLNAELNLTFAYQSENLPEVDALISNINIMPKHLGQLNIWFSPTPKIYLRFENVWMSKWLRVLLPFEEVSDDPYEKVDGYYTLDIIANFKVSDNLRIFVKAINVFDEQYGSLGATGLNSDLPYNPQYGSSLRFGLTYNLN